MKIGAIPENLLELLALPFGVIPTPLLDTFQAIVRARAIMVASKLGVFETIRNSSRTSTEVAERLKTDPRATEKLLSSLVSAGYLRFERRRYGLTRTARRWLLKDSPVSLHDNMLHRFLEWDITEHFEEFVCTGKHLHVHDNMTVDQWEIYQRGMRSLAGVSASEVSRRIPVPSTAKSMLDVGGSHGYYSVTVCRRFPQLKATILDLPAAIESARPLLEKEGMGDRIVHRAGDVLVTDVGTNEWDVVFISQLVHHFDEPTNVNLLKRLAQSLRPGGIVSILEILRPTSPNSAGQTGGLLDLFFAVTSLSGCWSLEEIASWQRQASLLPMRPIRLRSIPGAGIQAAVKRE